MAKHVDTTQPMNSPATDDTADVEYESFDTAPDRETPEGDEISTAAAHDARSEGSDAPRSNLRERLAGPAGAIILCAIVIVALSSVAGVLGHRLYGDREARGNENLFVESARQGVINLTTIHHNSVDADIKRILESSTGGFHDDFQRRAQSFAEVVKQAQTNSEGTVTAAAVQSQNPNGAKVLVTVTLKMSNTGAPEQPPRSWRMLIDVQRTGDTAKVSNVQFAT